MQSAKQIAALVLGLGLMTPSLALAEPPTVVRLATATPGGGFPFFGDAAASVINSVDPTLNVVTQNTGGSEENIALLERGEFDIALVAGIPAYNALAGVGRPPTKLKIISSIYSSFGLFAVPANSPARGVRDLAGKRVAWGTKASGLTALSRLAMSGIGLDRDKDFKATYLEKAAEGPEQLARGEIDAMWGGGIGWPNFTKATQNGARLIGFTDADVAAIIAKHPYLAPYTLASGSYAGQTEPLKSVSTWSVILARPDLPDATAYRLARALADGNTALKAKVPQASETLPRNTVLAAGDLTRIHPGTLRYLTELGLVDGNVHDASGTKPTATP